jgi:hypothetical protein
MVVPMRVWSRASRRPERRSRWYPAQRLPAQHGVAVAVGGLARVAMFSTVPSAAAVALSWVQQRDPVQEIVEIVMLHIARVTSERDFYAAQLTALGVDHAEALAKIDWLEASNAALTFELRKYQHTKDKRGLKVMITGVAFVAGSLFDGLTGYAVSEKLDDLRGIPSMAEALELACREADSAEWKPDLGRGWQDRPDDGPDGGREEFQRRNLKPPTQTVGPSGIPSEEQMGTPSIVRPPVSPVDGGFGMSGDVEPRVIPGNHDPEDVADVVVEERFEPGQQNAGRYWPADDDEDVPEGLQDMGATSGRRPEDDPPTDDWPPAGTGVAADLAPAAGGGTGVQTDGDEPDEQTLAYARWSTSDEFPDNDPADFGVVPEPAKPAFGGRGLRRPFRTPIRSTPDRLLGPEAALQQAALDGEIDMSSEGGGEDQAPGC